MTAQGPAFQSGQLQVWRASQSRVGSVSKIDPLPATVFPLPSQPHCRKAAYLDIRTDALIDDPMPRLICRAVYLSAKGRGRRLPKSVSAMMVAFIATLAVFHGRPALADATCAVERAVSAMEAEDGDFTLSFIPARSYASMASNLYACLGCPAGKLVRSGHVKRLCLLNGRFDFISEPPANGELAPASIMLPELGATRWYDAAAVSEDPAAERDLMPRGVFRRTKCLDDAPLEA